VQSIADACRKVGNKKGVPVMGIVTDVPSFLSGAENQDVSFYKKMFFRYVHGRAQKNACKFDSYLFLTEEMNNIINERNVPFIVMEGHCDTKMADIENCAENKSQPKIILYSGGIHREYGVKTLVEGFVKSSLSDWELHIYGYGNYSDELTEISQTIKNVKFFGVKPNDYIVRKQIEAFVVVNPRPTNEEFVKYSFPSKNLEYMASGTAMLTTLLPGMPKEYLDYVYTITDESVDGMKDALSKVASLSEEELINKGARAKEFVLREKNNVKQAQKIIAFIEKELLKK
jgi:glycosyltransferase involved in cell wall biosynthesis